jgi:hypothetical protein
MPFGKKKEPQRRDEVDFDQIYERGIKPAVRRFDIDCIRADEERSGGVIHLPMFERLLLAEIAIVDVTLANPNVYYELGVRHASRPRTTISISSCFKKQSPKCSSAFRKRPCVAARCAFR